MSDPILRRYRKVSLFFTGWLGLLKCALIIPVVFVVSMYLVVTPIGFLLTPLTGERITVSTLFAERPLMTWAMIVGSIFVAWGYFWVERRFFLRTLGPPEAKNSAATQQP